ncbi:major facilitator superfamily domain-containing protein [Lipomyces tetrasporus]
MTADKEIPVSARLDNSNIVPVLVLEKAEDENLENLPVRIIGDPELNERFGFNERSEEWHRKSRRKLLRKLDLHILPVIVVMYLLNYLDRSNLSQARLGTLEEDLGLVGNEFNIATSILFVGYLLMQIPSNIFLVRTRPSMYLGICMLIWGLISGLQATTSNFPGILVCRFFLGFVEAPFFPGIMMLLSSWYTRAEIAHRFALFYGGSQLGNMFGGLIAAGVLGNLHNAAGISGWRWLFIIEGIATVVISLLAIAVLPDYPNSTKWLTDEEKGYAVWCLSADIGEVDDNYSIGVKEAAVLALKDYKVYLFGLMLHANTLTQTFSYFFPTIVKTLGYSSTVTLLLTVPVWFVAFIFGFLISYHASRTNERTFHIISAMAIALLGNILVISTTNNAVRFFAMFLMPIGAFPGVQIILAWVANSMPRPAAKRSIALAICNVFSNSSNIYGSYLYPSSDGPRYITGGITISCMAVVCMLCALAMRFCLIRENKNLALAEEQVAAEAEAAGMEPSKRKTFRQII